MSTSKLDTSGVFQPFKVQAPQTRLTLPLSAIQFRRNGIEFQSQQALASWKEMAVDLQSPADGKKIHCTGVVVACHGNRHTGYSVSMLFMNLSRQSQERLERLAHVRSA